MRGATRPLTPLPPSVIAFQSTLLMRGATTDDYARSRARKKFQSTLLMRGATSCQPVHPRPRDFNPRSSCEERPRHSRLDNTRKIFQSTLLMRGATVDGLREGQSRRISIHAPHARSDACHHAVDVREKISIHAPHARSDCHFSPILRRITIFQSTLLMRGATASGLYRVRQI